MCEILPKMRKNLLVTTLKILQLLGTSSPKPPTGAPPLDPAMVLPILNLLPPPMHTAWAYLESQIFWSAMAPAPTPWDEVAMTPRNKPLFTYDTMTNLIVPTHTVWT